MATLEKRGRTYRLAFCYGGRRYRQSLDTKNEKTAQGILARVEDLLHRVSIGTETIPADVDLTTYLMSGTKRTERPVEKSPLTLKELFDRYFANIPINSLELDTIEGMRIHERQLLARLTPHFAIQTLTLSHLQAYVNERAKDPGHHGTVTATTIKKAIVTLRTVWNWGVQHGHLQGRFPNNGLKFPKSKEKLPFMTYSEIERIAKGIDEKDQAELWECLYLTLAEISELLDYVQEHARQPFVYPMFVFAAHTGARRSEMLRSKVTDIDFGGNFVTIHERKKSHDSLTTRRVPMSPLLREGMQKWLASHPGGEFTFCQGTVARSKTRRVTVQPIQRDEAHDHFKRTLAGSKWDKLRGWHVFRHSFCSNCASKWIDQRLINEWVGHLSDSMVRRYRHLIPDQQQHAIRTVFEADAKRNGKVA